MSNKHTATPYHHKKLVGVTDRGFALFSTRNRLVGMTTHRLDSNGEFTEEDAAFIVRACNAHDDLVAALQHTLSWLLECETELGAPIGIGYKGNMQKPVTVEKIRAALAKATHE